MSTRLIAHRLLKKQHDLTTETVLREALLPASNALAEDLMQELRTGLTQRNPIAGRFTRIGNVQPAFELHLVSYLKARTDEAFVSLSREATTQLADRMRTESLATGGYLVFAEYEHDREDFLLVVLLSPRAQPSFDEALNLVASITLDFEHLRHAGRVRLGSVPTNDDGVVHFVSRSAEGVSDYFREFLGCEAVTDSTAQGNLLYTALRGLSVSGKMGEADAKETMQRTYTYWQECRKNGEPMMLTALANLLSPRDPAIVLRHIAEETTGLAGEFSAPSPKVMRQFVKFAFSASGLKIEFDRNEWLGKITVKGQSVTIRQAPAGLIARINEEQHGE